MQRNVEDAARAKAYVSVEESMGPVYECGLSIGGLVVRDR